MFNFGGAHAYGSPKPASVHAPIVGMAVDHATGGYWLAAADGSVYNFNAPASATPASQPLNQPIVGIAADEERRRLLARRARRWHLRVREGAASTVRPAVCTSTSRSSGSPTDARTGGYWLVASDGGIFAFDAPFHGSTGAMHLNKPIVGIAADAASGGYWLVASDGGVFAFNAPFYGSTGAIHLNKPIVGMAATDDARGYRFVASDGGVFNFGDAKFSGSTGGSGLVAPVVAVAERAS